MIATPPPTDAEGRLQWLVDRAEISDVIVEFAAALDARDGERYSALYAEDGVLELPGGIRAEGRAALRAGVESGLTTYGAVWHLSANHAIALAGDTARARSYVIAVHRHGDDPRGHATGAGWYTMELRRTPEGWRFTSVRLDLVWASGEGLPGEPRPGARS